MHGTRSFEAKRVVVFSQLRPEQKQKYIKFITQNQVSAIQDQNGHFVAKIRIQLPIKSKKTSTGRKETKATREMADINDLHEKYSSVLQFVSRESKVKSRAIPHERPLVWLTRAINDIYESRFEDHKQALHANTPELPFGKFVYHFFRKRYGLGNLVEQHCLDMMSALRKYSAERIDAQMFTSFVTDEYDQEDLLFFLFVRSMVQKASRLSSTSLKQSWNESLSYEESLSIAQLIFGTTDDQMFQEFNRRVSTHLKRMTRRTVKIQEFLHMAVQVYRQTKIQSEIHGHWIRQDNAEVTAVPVDELFSQAEDAYNHFVEGGGVN